MLRSKLSRKFERECRSPAFEEDPIPIASARGEEKDSPLDMDKTVIVQSNF